MDEIKRIVRRIQEKRNQLPSTSTTITQKIIQKPDGLINPSHLQVGTGYSVGKQRSHNEDSVFTLTSYLSTNRAILPFGLFIVADGMGGHENGEIASETANRIITNQIVSNIFPMIYAYPPKAPKETIHEIILRGFSLAQKTLANEVPGAGTTVTCLLVTGDQMTIAHLGDSRAYLFQLDGTIKKLTRDHSLVQRLEELGQITQEEADSHPQRHVLYRALGVGEEVEPDIITTPLPKSGSCLLCSDGLTCVVSDDQMAKIISNFPEPQEACNQLIAAANYAGGPDNISVIIVKLPATV